MEAFICNKGFAIPPPQPDLPNKQLVFFYSPQLYYLNSNQMQCMPFKFHFLQKRLQSKWTL